MLPLHPVHPSADTPLFNWAIGQWVNSSLPPIYAFSMCPEYGIITVRSALVSSHWMKPQKQHDRNNQGTTPDFIQWQQIIDLLVNRKKWLFKKERDNVKCQFPRTIILCDWSITTVLWRIQRLIWESELFTCVIGHMTELNDNTH